jgi:ERCC4-type nuclease
MKILIDSREQCPLRFGPGVQVETATLPSGDYSLLGFDEAVALERKSIADLVSSLTSERDRFRRECLRLRSYAVRGVIVEATLSDVVSGRYRSNASPNAILASVASWSLRFDLPFWFAGDSAVAGRLVETIFRQFLRQRIEECRRISPLVDEVSDSG